MGDHKLSPRQAEVLDLVRQGRTSGQIASELGISPRTVDQYVGESCDRLEARNRTHAVAKAMRLRLIGGSGHGAVKSSRR